MKIRRPAAARAAAFFLIFSMLLSLAACGASPAASGDASAPAAPGDTSAAESTVPAGTEAPGSAAAAVKELLAAAPEAVGGDMSADDFCMKEYGKWIEEQLELAKAAVPFSRKTAAYSLALMQQILAAEDGNRVCSPLNTYFAFAMLAETCAGNSRQQILDMLGAENMDDVRKTVAALWKANCFETPLTASLLADSLWMNDAISYNEDTLNTLAQYYFTSSFRGIPGSNEMNEALQKWTNDATGGLLKDYVKDLELSPETVLAILSTLYYKAEWEEAFGKMSAPLTFHGTKGDTEAEMMQTETHGLVETDHFTLVRVALKGGGSMLFYLPVEGVSVNDLLSDPAVTQYTCWESNSEEDLAVPVRLTVPKFKVSGKTDLLPVLAALGATDVLDASKADFSPLMEGSAGLAVSKAEHAAMVEIDEDGVTGAAYTIIELSKGISLPEKMIEVVFDRPFLFMVTGADGSILFSGTVRNID